MALTIRLSKDEDKALSDIKSHFDLKTASGGISKAVSNFMGLYAKADRLQYENIELKREIENIKEMLIEHKETKIRVNSLQSNITRWANR